MNKRIVCVLLTLIMLLSLVPMGASAASHKTSEAAITVLKQMTKFSSTCEHFTGKEFRTGYGTVCEEEHHFNTNGTPDNARNQNKHTITEPNADLALRKALLALDEKVCSFESANGLSLAQHQHDALVVFSFNAGTDWMTGNGVLKSTIINGGDATELLNAMNLWTNNAHMDRRKVEVNMYMNGIYTNTVPTSYGSVTYDPNDGSMPQSNYIDANAGLYTFHYDLYTSMAHPVVPTRNGYKFLGWYLNEPYYIAWEPTLEGYLAGNTLVALWQSNNASVNQATQVSYQLLASQLADQKVYNWVGSETVNEDLTKDLAEELNDNGNLVWVDRDYIDANGDRWSHLMYVGGWVKVGPAADNNTTTDSYGTVIATATVTANGYLNLRQEPGTDSKIIGALAKNDTVNIYEIRTVNGHQWGRSKSGWLCLTYTRLIMKEDASISDAGALAYTFSGTVLGDLKVHVEAGGNTNYVEYYVPNNYRPTWDGSDEDLFIPEDTWVILTNMVIVNNNETWVKATWENPEWDWVSDNAADGKEWFDVTRSGWIRFNNQIVMDPVDFTVVADTVNVRVNAGDAAALAFTLNKGVQVEVDEIAMKDENLWGHIHVKLVNHVGTAEAKEGWVNLASKYFTRDDAPVVENNASTHLIATVINTDALKVRSTGASYGAKIGTLARGTTVAVWESNEDGWYKVDYNQNGVYDYEEDGWCSGVYLDVREGTIGGSSTVTDSNGNKYQTDGTGKGIVANTYSGVNVRTGPSTGYATNGKLLPGTVVEVLETANAGKWGRVAQGWVCMDYVTMITYNETIPENSSNGGTTVESFDKADKTTTTAVYPGTLNSGTKIFRTPEDDGKDSELIRITDSSENVTMYELATVTKVVESDEYEVDDKTTTTTITSTTYWARINDGWVKNPETCLSLTALDEKVHTQTGVSKLNVRKGTDTEANDAGEVFDILVQGDQVNVTALDIIKDKVWGRIETTEGTGWIRLDYMSEGAVYEKAPVQNNVPAAPSGPVLGIGSSTGGFVNNGSGYRYTGKVIRANEVNVRSHPSTTATKTTALKNGAALVIYETTVAENMAWGRCDAGWVYLYYVDLTPVVNGAVDARVVYNDNTIIYTDVNCGAVAGTYSRMSTIDIYEIVGKMARTEKGWVSTDDLL